MSWHEGPLIAFDLETTSVDVETARIVTACVALIDGSGRRPPKIAKWLVNPGVEIPEQAAAIHGITTERARAEGGDPSVAAQEIGALLADHVEAGAPIVAFNAAYDLTVHDRECRRYGLPTLTDVCEDDELYLYVVDPFVIDKAVDKWRKGSRKLADQCTHYGVRLDGAHDASFDAVAAARIAWRIAQRYPEIAAMSLHDLHAFQVEAKRQQDADYAAYLRKLAMREKDADEQIKLHERAAKVGPGHWPLIPYAGEAVSA